MKLVGKSSWNSKKTDDFKIVYGLGPLGHKSRPHSPLLLYFNLVIAVFLPIFLLSNLYICISRSFSLTPTFRSNSGTVGAPEQKYFHCLLLFILWHYNTTKIYISQSQSLLQMLYFTRLDSYWFMWLTIGSVK